MTSVAKIFLTHNIDKIYKMTKIVFIEEIWLCGVDTERMEQVTYGTAYHHKRCQFAENTFHDWATNKRMKALFVHSVNIRGWFTITSKAYGR
jgi:hypothetical protein